MTLGRNGALRALEALETSAPRTEVELCQSELNAEGSVELRSEDFEQQSERAEARWRSVHAEAQELRLRRQEAQSLGETCREELASARGKPLEPCEELFGWLRREFDREVVVLREAFEGARPRGQLFETTCYLPGSEVERQRALEAQERLKTQERRAFSSRDS